MNHLQENSTHTTVPRRSRHNRGSAYQNLSELPIHNPRPPLSHHRRRRGPPNNRTQHYTRRRNRPRNQNCESPVDTELRQSVNRFLNKYHANQMYTLILFLIAILGNVNPLEDMIAPVCLIGLAVGYIIHLIILYSEARNRIEERRIEYKIFEFGVATALVFFPSRENSHVYFAVLATFLLISYLFKAIASYNCNYSSLISFANQVSRAILLIRLLIFVQGAILSVQITFRNPIPHIIAFIPLLAIATIILLFTVKFLLEILFVDRRQLWSSDPCEKTMGLFWILGNLLSTSILLLLVFTAFADHLWSQQAAFRFCLVVIIWCSISIFSNHTIRNGVFEICRAIVAKLEDSPDQEEPQQPKYVIKISNTYFKRATEDEINKLSDNAVNIETPCEDDIESCMGTTSSDKRAKCIVCYRKLARAVFMDCGHGGVCFTCAKKINRRQGECHMCRQKIKAILTVDVKNNKGRLYEIVEEIVNRE